MALIHCWGEAKIGSNQDDLNNHCRKVAILAIRTKNGWKKRKEKCNDQNKGNENNRHDANKVAILGISVIGLLSWTIGHIPKPLTA